MTMPMMAISISALLSRDRVEEACAAHSITSRYLPVTSRSPGFALAAGLSSTLTASLNCSFASNELRKERQKVDP